MIREIGRRSLDEMPFDKEFDGELCHATGEEVLLDLGNGYPAEWWEEFEDSEGNLHYGR